LPQLPSPLVPPQLTLPLVSVSASPPPLVPCPLLSHRLAPLNCIAVSRTGMSLHAGPTPGRPFGSSAPPSVCDVIGSAPPPAFKSRVSAEGVQSVGGSRSRSVVWGPPPVSGRVVLDFPFLGSLLELPRGSLPERSLPERSLPERSLPERSLPERSLPERSLPERSLPELLRRTLLERVPRSGCYSAQVSELNSLRT